MGQNVEFPSNGSTAGGYLATPAEGAGLGLIVLQEWWGLVPHIEEVCDRFAAEGFTALAPDLYHGTTVPNSEPDEAGKVMMALNLAQAAKDLSGAVDYLCGLDTVRGEGVGVTGFCMGGGLAMVLACQRPDKVQVCVPFYGVIPWPDAEPDWTKLAAPIEGYFAENDGFFTPDKVRELETKLRDLGKEVNFTIYPNVDHAFFNDTRPEVYDADTARDTWERALSFLRSYLG